MRACRMTRTGLCDNTAKPGQLMCLRCWTMVPQPLKDRINELWREAGRNPVRLTPDYFDAVRAAEAAVRERLAPS